MPMSAGGGGGVGFDVHGWEEWGFPDVEGFKWLD